MENKRTILLMGLSFGDEGKGTVTDFFVRRLRPNALVVRYNGGAQAAHNVVDPDGRHHTFCQFGSGTLVPGTRTLLSRFTVVNPISVLDEAERLAKKGVPDPCRLISVDSRALIVTPYHVAANRSRELARGDARHGSVGQGIGEAVGDSLCGGPVIRAGDLLLDDEALLEKLRATRFAKMSQLSRDGVPLPSEGSSAQLLLDREVLESDRHDDAFLSWYRDFAGQIDIVGPSEANALLRNANDVVFEGAQGVMLHESAGFYPYVTWSDTTFANAVTLLEESGRRSEVTRVGVFRAYSTRHGAGPFVPESETMTGEMADPHNRGDHEWQGAFRVGPFDLVAAKYALRLIGGVDYLAFTCLDRMPASDGGWDVCDGYGFAADGELAKPFVDALPLAREMFPVRPFDLGAQENLALALASAKPQFSRVPSGTAEEFVGVLAECLGVPVGVLSFGEGAESKRLVAPVAGLAPDVP